MRGDINMLSPYFMANDPLIQFAGAFLLIFAIVFGAVKLTNIGRDKSAAAMVSVAIALFASLNQSVVAFIWQIMPYAAIILVFLFFFILIKSNLGIGGGSAQSSSKDTMITVVVLFFLLLLLYILYQNGMLSFISPDMEENVLWGIGILIVVVIILLAGREVREITPEKVGK